MVKAAYVDKNGLRKGAWSEEEDNKLRAYILRYGHWNWRLLPQYAGLNRCGKSCRLRWMNYLKHGLKRGNYSKEEDDLIVKLHDQLGAKWSVIAAKLPGRTDNDIKNYWNGHLKERSKRSKAENFQDEKSSEVLTPCINHEKEVSRSDVTSTFPTLSSQKGEKRSSKVSSDMYILESSSSLDSVVSNWVLDSAVGQNLPEISPAGSDSVAFSWGSNIDDSISCSDPFLSEFQGSFWTEPFMVDKSDAQDFFNFLLLDEDGLLSPYLSGF